VAFRFKHFTIEDQFSTMRVGTDAMLLGAWARPPVKGRMLDIGTGCGVLALMMAQKSGAVIEAIDIDLPSVQQARENFNQSPWSGRLEAIQASLELFSGKTENKYDFIISNPPYFAKALRSPSARKNSTRHDETLTSDSLLLAVTRLLARNGRFAVILPPAIAAGFVSSAISAGLFLSRMLEVLPRPASGPNLALMEFAGRPGKPVIPGSLAILSETGKYSDEYLQLTADYHDFLPATS